jgi:hypothetical protein
MVGDGPETLGGGAEGPGFGASADPQAIKLTSSKDARIDHLICSHLRREETTRSSRNTERMSAPPP